MITTTNIEILVNGRDVVVEFQRALAGAVDGFVKAGALFVEAIDENAKNREKFEAAFPAIRSSAWSDFEKIGRKQVHPRLMLNPPCIDGRVNSMVKRLPYSVQEKIINRTRFPMLLPNGDTLMVDIAECTREQADLLISINGIRSLAEQRVILAQRETKQETEPAPEVMPYTIVNGKVRFRRDVILTRQEIRRILSEM